MKAVRSSLAGALLLLLTLSADRLQADIGTLDLVPGATLLLPYFEVDLQQAAFTQNDVQVRFGNASPNPTLAHVTLFTDLGVPTFSFDVYLAGWDVAEISVRLVFAGVLPRTGPGLNNRGNYSNPAVSFPGCAPIVNPDRLSTAVTTHLKNAHTGQPSASWGNLCGGQAIDAKARGFLTIDAASQCSAAFPGDNGYFVNGGTGIATDSNVLWGDSWTVDGANNAAAADSLIALEASTTDARVTVNGKYTFYGWLVNGTARDNREPLATRWVHRFAVGTGLAYDTSTLVWRDAGGPVVPFTCGSQPTYYPLGQQTIVVFDEEEETTVVTGISPFPAMANRVRLGTAALPITPPFGAIGLNLSTTTPGGLFAGVKQSAVTYRTLSPGRYETGLRGFALDNATAPAVTSYP